MRNDENQEIVTVHEDHLVPGGEFYAERGKEIVVGWYNKEFVYRVVSISYEPTDNDDQEKWAVCTTWLVKRDSMVGDCYPLTVLHQDELFTMLGDTLR